ncbi:MAG: NAD(P)-binding domain-containing protein [Alphaproteobacteria bacterium]|nr:NAD(P)-binding domain-containing protein [Alphaproteobacteria bacterium]
MLRNDAIIIGAGQAGLAMSRCLSMLGVDHAVLERGRVAERWRSERWDSLRLLTPNWMSRLPGWSYAGADPDGYMTMPEVTAYLAGYARASAAPVETDTAVRAVWRAPVGYRIETGRGIRHARVVVVATGDCDVPFVPPMARRVSSALVQVTPTRYRNARELPAGGVLVVGASASGVQLAEEIHRSGRPVALAVGDHTRLPRVYRGRDIMAWMERIGILDQTVRDVRDIARARAQPSLQLVGDPARRNIDLTTLQAQGVRLLGRLVDVADGVLLLADDLDASVAAAQGTMERMLARIDLAADIDGAPREAWPARFAPGTSPTRLDPAAAGIRTIVWATGFRRDYRWLRVPVLDAAGEIRHDGGVTPVPGLYVLGLRFMRRRRSSFLDGVGLDAAALAADIHEFLAANGRASA